MPLNQSVNEITFFINENNQHILDILKAVLGIPSNQPYTMKSDNEHSAFFMIYDGNNTGYTSFSVEYLEQVKEFNISMGCAIKPFENYDFNNHLYACTVILDSTLKYIRTELTFYETNEDNDMLIFIEEDGNICVSYLSPPAIFEEFILTSKNFMTDSFHYEVFFLTDLYVTYPSIFKTYTIAELFNARTDSVLLNDMKQISDMATI